MHHKKDLGKDSVSKGMEEIEEQLHLKDWENFGRQAFRMLISTALGNDASVNTSESIYALRHKATTALEHYNKTSGISEKNRHKSLGIIKNSNEH